MKTIKCPVCGKDVKINMGFEGFMERFYYEFECCGVCIRDEIFERLKNNMIILSKKEKTDGRS